MSTSHHSSYISRPPPYSYFCPCHIFNVVSMAIWSVLLILSAVSTLVISNKAKICFRALINHFLSVSSPINSSKSPCTRLLNVSRKSKTPSVESVLILLSSRYSSSSLLISLKISVASTHCWPLFLGNQKDF